ncbi:TIR domain-containing protein [Agrobacterium leguminum]|uniref:TIR domain-containing protein n=1 Tax=Agrobacterium leguminum TaxID=2792015 RepID=UPI00272DA083|nr:TIR domain-containing protein [Agrobacterium leguminum]WLD95986.1 TIR domain-containing protein [Agrobacterium leguminum]
MARKCFYSFHYDDDNWRVSTVKNIGAIEGQQLIAANDFEELKRQGDKAVSDWIAKNMAGRSTVIVLIGSNTAARKWVNHEIKYGFENGKALVGIHIHRLLDRQGNPSKKGANPFETFTVGAQKTPLTNWAKTYDPGGSDSKAVYETIKNNIESWVEEAIKLRA